MEIRQSLATGPSRAIAVVAAGLALLALVLTAWFTLGTRVSVSSSPIERAPMTNQLPLDCKNDPYSPHDPICQPYHDPYSPHDPIQ